MSVAQIRIVDIGIDATFEGVVVGARICRLASRCSRQAYIEECWYVAKVEQTAIPQVDRLGEDFLVREHVLGEKIPCFP